jgi:hypothetical protein
VADREPRDWNETLRRWLRPFQSEQAAFNVLLWTLAVAAVFVVLLLLIRAVT